MPPSRPEPNPVSHIPRYIFRGKKRGTLNSQAFHSQQKLTGSSCHLGNLTFTTSAAFNNFNLAITMCWTVFQGTLRHACSHTVTYSPFIEAVNVRPGDCDCDSTVTERSGPSGTPCHWCIKLGLWKYSRGYVMWRPNKGFVRLGTSTLARETEE